MIVIPMAGLSSRFKRAGYDQPKWQLPLAGRPLFDWTVLTFQRYFDTERFVFVHLDEPNVAEFIRNRVESLGLKETVLVPLRSPTRGQAETVFLALEDVTSRDDELLTVFNIDTIRPDFIIPALQAGTAGWLECFRGDGDHWSFVRPVNSEGDLAAQVVEKIRVSDLCSTGMYVFRNRSDFIRAYELELQAPSSSELFVAPLYQHLINSGEAVRFGEVPKNDVIFSGTPSEYDDAVASGDSILHRFRNLAN
jgi:choline kinase